MGGLLNPLDRLLERVTLEPAYGPGFYKALFESDVYVLLPAGDTPRPGGRIRFVMWTGQDGQQVIPFFSNRAAIRRVLNTDTQALRVNGRDFLEACRGAFVVLNPNERYFLRLTPPELALLLDTGSPNVAEYYTATQNMQVEIAMPDAPAELLTSLSLLFSQEPAVERAFLATLRPGEDAPAVWLVAAFIDTHDAAQWVSQQMAAVLADRPPSHSVDLLRLARGSDMAAAIESTLAPFYERKFGTKVVMDTQAGLQ
jgi:hypothetical protein